MSDDLTKFDLVGTQRNFIDAIEDVMSERIEPALTPEQWQDVSDHYDKQFTVTPGVFLPLDRLREAPAAAIAVGNFYLEPDDPRKITRDIITLLRQAAGGPTFIPSGADIDRMKRFLDALEKSYLPATGE